MVLGHLWVHVMESKPWLILSGEGVSLFLFLSGFGLTQSFLFKYVDVAKFFKKRFKKVIIPYWFFTILFLILDFYLLDKTYSISQIFLTFIGINIAIVLQHIDYVRWYITFLFFWYMCFGLFFYSLKPSQAVTSLFIVALITMLLSYYVIKLPLYKFFAFPAGCLLSLYRDRVNSYFKMDYKWILGISLASVGIFLVINLIIHKEWLDFLPSILIAFIYEMNSIVFIFGLLLLFGTMGKCSLCSCFLLFCGGVSYELYLLHGPLLIKYNILFKFITQHSNGFMLPSMFVLLVFLLLVLSWFAHKVFSYVKQ